MARGQGRAVDAEVLGDAGAEIMNQNIRRRRQFLKIRSAGSGFQVQGDGLLVAVDHVEGQGVAVPEIHAHAARIVAAVDPLDLQHLGAQIAHDGAGEGRGQHLPQFQDANSLQH